MESGDARQRLTPGEDAGERLELARPGRCWRGKLGKLAIARAAFVVDPHDTA